MKQESGMFPPSQIGASHDSRNDEAGPQTEHPADSEAQFEVPCQFGDYRLLQVLGVGGTGDVYVAESPRFDEPIALKIAHPIVGAEDARARYYEKLGCDPLEWEFQVGQNLDHPNVIRIFEYGRTDGMDYLAAERFEAPTLEDYLYEPERRERLLLRFSQIIKQCAAGLGHLHQAGYVHCDVKPGNFLVGSNFEIKLIDFGLCKPIINNTLFHDPGWVAGTRGFIAPEQSEKIPLDERTDIYSLAVLMHIWLTGEMPYAERRSMGARELSETPVIPMVRRLNAEVSEELANLVAGMLSPEKENRPATMGQFLAEFGALEPFCTSSQ
ncbi:MAG: serine/threonine protein kinase [Pirellulales bacterium]|nr:serine/threonine protein kinase [Pirellulales bacterium]